MGDDKGRGHNLESENALQRSLPHFRSDQCPNPLLAQIRGDAFQYFCQKCTRSATWIQHQHLLAGKSVCDSQVVLERTIHTCDHVADHFGRCVPNAHFLPEVRIELLEKGLIEVLHCLVFPKSTKEGVPVDTGQCARGPVQYFDQIKSLEATWTGQLFEECSQHWGA